MNEHLMYVEGDATLPGGTGNRIVAHCCNDEGRWGSGFVLSLSARYPEAERRYRAWAQGRLPRPIAMELGMVQFVRVEEQVWVANMIGQQGVRSRHNPKPLREEALRTCLRKVAERARELNATVHMPRIGAHRAGGKWAVVEQIIQEEIVARGLQVTVYDLPPEMAAALEKRTAPRTRGSR